MDRDAGQAAYAQKGRWKSIHLPSNLNQIPPHTVIPSATHHVIPSAVENVLSDVLYSRRLSRVNADPPPAAPGLELHDPIDQRIQRVIVALAHVHTGVKRGAALADQNSSGPHDLAREFLYAKPFRVGPCRF